MTILTVGPSPHLNNSLGRLHRDLLLAFKEIYHTECIATLHDILYFLPNQSGDFLYENIKIHPFLDAVGALAPFCINTMKSLQPNVVVTIGYRKEHEYMAIIKSMYPNLFKWVAIIPTVGPFGSDIYELNLADSIILTNKQSYCSIGTNTITNTSVFHIPYGGDSNVFNIQSESRKLSAVYCCKNAIESNPGVLINAVTKAHIPTYIHYNLDDPGDYNVDRLITIGGSRKYVTLPKNFVSLKEGLADNLMNDIYNAHFLVMDCSMQSKTGVSVIEGMLAGCVPVGPNFGAVGDIIESLPEEYRFFIPHERIMWFKEEEAAAVSEEGLVGIFKEIKHKFMNDKDWRKNAAQKMREKGLIFSKENFVQMTKGIVESVANKESAILVDSY